VDVAPPPVTARPCTNDHPDTFKDVEVVGEEVGRDVELAAQVDRRQIRRRQLIDDLPKRVTSPSAACRCARRTDDTSSTYDSAKIESILVEQPLSAVRRSLRNE
jgi:hypothetical protein